MRQALEEQIHMPDIEDLGFEERLGLLVDREYTERETRRLRTRLSKARLRHNASPEDIDYRTPRGLDKSLMTKLATCGWVREHPNVLIIGPTGIGKTWLACALAHKACREGFSASHLRLPRIFRELTIAKGDGRHHKLLGEFAKTDLLVLDDLCMPPLTDAMGLQMPADRSVIVAKQIVADVFEKVKMANIVRYAGEDLLDGMQDRSAHVVYQRNRVAVRLLDLS